MTVYHDCGRDCYLGVCNLLWERFTDTYRPTRVRVAVALRKLLISPSEMFSMSDTHLCPSGSFVKPLRLAHASGGSDEVGLDGV